MIQTKTVKPILDLANNSSVQVLAKDTATFTMEGIAYSSACEALLHLSPRPSLVFQAKVPDGKVSIPQMLGMIEPRKTSASGEKKSPVFMVVTLGIASYGFLRANL